MTDSRRQVIDRLHESKCSCVILKDDVMTQCTRRGVMDLYMLVKNEDPVLHGAFIADKVVGKGAAALMVLGGVTGVYADVISLPALALLEDAGIETSYGQIVDNIINRAGTGICPVESLCSECLTASDCLPLITEFISNIITDKNQSIALNK